MADRDLDDFVATARTWLVGELGRPSGEDQAGDTWGSGELDLAVFKNLTEEAEAELIAREAQWQQRKLAAGYGAITWPAEHGGAGLDRRFETAFRGLEASFDPPLGHELLMVTIKLIAPTLRDHADSVELVEVMADLVAARELCCQLFSEPGAGSDLASLATRARLEDDGWHLSGQKIWSSGAHHADWGLAIARTDPDVVKHRGLTAFMVRLDAPGVDVRPIRQMSGGASFCEVYLDDVVIPDSHRVGAIGRGWAVTLATLGFEREASDGSAGVGGSWADLRQLAEHVGGADDPLVRQMLARVFTQHRLNELAAAHDASRRAAGDDLGAAGSLRKLQWVSLLRAVSEASAEILESRLVADTGEWGTFAWNDHVLGALGYSIAGGTDEVQRNIIAERLLGLPGEPRADKDVPWSEVPR